YVHVILQLIDKAGDFVSDDIWYRVVQFVTNNEDLQPYAAAKAREYLEKPALHETMVKVSAYLLGEYSHLLARRTGCTPKEIFIIINEKLPTVTTSTVAILLSTYAKILMHNHPPDPELQEQIWSIFRKYESYIDVEIQQRAVEYIALCNKGAALVDVLAEMPKFPERQSALLKKAEDAEVDTAEQSAIRLRSQQQTSNTLVVTNQRPTEGSLPVSQLGLVRMPSEASTQDQTSFQDQGMTKENGVISEVVPQDVPPADLLGDLVGPLAINGSPVAAIPVEQRNQNLLSVLEATPEAAGPLALATVDNQPNSIQPIVNIAERFNELCLKDSGVLYEDPHIQVQCPLEFVNLRASRDVAVLDISYKFGTATGNIKLRLPAVMNKFLHPISVTAEEFFLQWKSLSGPPLKLQEVLRGVKPLSLPEMANLFTSLHLAVAPGIDTNPNNLIACATFYSESTRAMLCLIRVETDPSDRTQLRITIASGDPTLTLKERIKEYLVDIPTQTPSAVVAPLQPQSPVTPVAYNDPGAMLAGLL
ncbi:Alpha adaptin AP2, C-terminal domain, partial [Musa troglodytarum]